MAAAVKIPPQGEDGALQFDLREVMDAVGDHEDLTWHLSDPQIVWPDDTPPESLRTLLQDGAERGRATMSWAEMELFAASALQFIDCRFTGLRGNDPVVSLAAIDSSYWVVWARDDGVLDRVRRAFDRVENYNEPPPALGGA